MSDVFPRDWFKVMSPLQQQRVEAGKCPPCKRRLVSKYVCEEMEALQCPKCLGVYMLPTRRLVG